MLRHKLLRISSKDRDVLSDSTSDFHVNVNNVKELQIAKSIVVKQITIPNVFYNITSRNNSFTYNIASTPTTVSIAEGQYTVTTLIAALEAAAVGITLTITQDTTTLKLSFTSATAVEFLDIDSSSIAEVLGIEYGTGSGADVTVYTATGLPDLSGHQNVFVESTTIGTSNLIRTNGVTSHTIAVVPITVPFGVVEQYVSQHTEIDDVDVDAINGKDHSHIDIRLVDHDGNTMDLNGHHVSIVFKVYY